VTPRTQDPIAALDGLRKCLAGRDLAGAGLLVTRPAVLAGLTELVAPARLARLEAARQSPEWQAEVARWRWEREAARLSPEVGALVAVLGAALAAGREDIPAPRQAVAVPDPEAARHREVLAEALRKPRAA